MNIGVGEGGAKIARIAMIAKIADIEKTRSCRRFTLMIADQKRQNLTTKDGEVRSGDPVIARDRVMEEAKPHSSQRSLTSTEEKRDREKRKPSKRGKI